MRAPIPSDVDIFNNSELLHDQVHVSYYPKDLALYAYMHGMTGTETWEWTK